MVDSEVALVGEALVDLVVKDLEEQSRLLISSLRLILHNYRRGPYRRGQGVSEGSRPPNIRTGIGNWKNGMVMDGKGLILEP